MAVRFITADVLEGLRQLPDESVHCVVTSPPYWGLRDYGVAGQIGLEPTPQGFVDKMVAVFRAVRRVLRSDGTLWLNIGDAYAGSWGAQSRGDYTPGTLDYPSKSILSARQIEAAQRHAAGIGSAKRTPGLKPKDLMGMPWRVAFALQADGWWLRGDYIWAKPNPMPESVTDRCTKAHEYVFHLAKSERYYFNAEAIKERAGDDIGPGVGGWAAPGTLDHTAVGQNRPGITSHGDINKRIGAKGNANTFRGGSYVNGQPGPRTAVGNVRKSDSTNGSAMPGAAPHTGLHRAGDPREVPSRNKRSVWTIATVPYPEAHFATFPPALAEVCILAGCPEGGTVLDPFSGAGTTAMVADRLGRDAIGIDINPDYVAMAERRVARDRLERKQGTMADVAAAQIPLTPLEELMQGGKP
jgi:DNA modification methylase